MKVLTRKERKKKKERKLISRQMRGRKMRIYNAPFTKVLDTYRKTIDENSILGVSRRLFHCRIIFHRNICNVGRFSSTSSERRDGFTEIDEKRGPVTHSRL